MIDDLIAARARSAALDAALRLISGQAACFGVRADEAELRGMLERISGWAEAALAGALAGAPAPEPDTRHLTGREQRVMGAALRQSLKMQPPAPTPEPVTLPVTIPADGWQPIETAPKDGPDGRPAYFLAYCPDESAINPQSCLCVCWWEPKIEGGCWYGEADFRLRPTHWTPLPPTPTGGDAS